MRIRKILAPCVLAQSNRPWKLKSFIQVSAVEDITTTNQTGVIDLVIKRHQLDNKIPK